MEALKRAVVQGAAEVVGGLFTGGVLGDGLGTFTDSVLGQLTREEETDGSLDLPRCDCAAFVVVSQTTGLG